MRRAKAISGANTRTGEHSEKAQQALRNGLIGSPDTIRKRLTPVRGSACRSGNPAESGREDIHQDICESLDLFAREVMPEFHDRQPAQEQWKQDVLSRKIVLEDLDTEKYDLYHIKMRTSYA